MSTAARLATYDDLLAIPEGTKAEVIDGELITFTSPLPAHRRVQSRLSRLIGAPFDDENQTPEAWWLIQEVDIRFASHDIASPDVAGWHRCRLPNPWKTRPIEVVPDWICEVLSPSNERHDRVRKMDLYWRHRVPVYWLIDPDRRVVEVYTHHSNGWTNFGAFDGYAVPRLPPFAAIELPIREIFPPEERTA
jgi:Uma2 family endonuclease